MKKLVSLSLLLILFSTCKKDAVTEVAEEKVPVADFNLSKSEYVSGETIELTNNSVDAETIRWTLPDGSTSRANSVSYPTKESGVLQTFVFKLEAISKSGTKSDYIVKNLTTKVTTGKLVIAQNYFFSEFLEGELTVAGENKGKVKINRANSIDDVNCDDQKFLNYISPIGPSIVTFKSNSGGILTFNINISKSGCNKLIID